MCLELSTTIRGFWKSLWESQGLILEGHYIHSGPLAFITVTVIVTTIIITAIITDITVVITIIIVVVTIAAITECGTSPGTALSAFNLLLL